MSSSHAAAISALRVDRERRVAQIAALQRSFTELVSALDSSNADDEHDPEGPTIAFERAQLLAQSESAQAGLAAIEEAMVRATTGTYGMCQTCGQPIGPDRLDALPAATTCLACARR